MSVKAFVAAIAIETVLLGTIVLVALDMRAHKRVETLGGVNFWGYRGTVLREKQANEIRIAVVGGDLAFGWGVAADETLSGYLRRLVDLGSNRPGEKSRLVTGVNLGARGLAPADYASWIDHFAYLRPDLICIVPDPPAHRPVNDQFLPDRHSKIFVAFGYSPILPLVLEEKGALIRSTGLRAIGTVLAKLDPSVASEAQSNPTLASRSLESAVDAAERIATKGVVLVWPPDFGADKPVADTYRASTRSRVRVVDLDQSRAMHSDDLRLDGFHFSAGGHSRAADIVAPAALELVHAAGRENR